MYHCRHCGFVSRSESINYCNNTKCRYYGYHESSCDPASKREEAFCQPPKRQEVFCSPSKREERSPCRDHMTFARDNFCVRKETLCENREMPHMNQSFAKNESLPSSEHSLAFATVPFEKLERLYSLQEGLTAGTIFPELHMPYDKKIIRRG